MSTAPKDFPRAWDLLLLAAVNGWAVSWTPGEESGHPWVRVTLSKRGTFAAEYRVTWHTRQKDGSAGRPWMFSALTCRGAFSQKWQATTLAAIRADITREAQP